MRRRLLVCLVWAALLWSIPARAADMVCEFAGEPPPTSGQRASLANIAKELAAAPRRGENWRALQKRLVSLIDGPCLRGLKNIADLPEFGSAAALRLWWIQGGKDWVWSAFTFQRGNSIVLPPTARKTLNLGNDHSQALAPVLCPADDDSCGRETRGWVMRAEDKTKGWGFETYQQQLDAVAYCNKVDRPTAAARYAAWRDCFESERYRQFAHRPLPLGPFRAPTDGWLLVRGRRGHYDFCDEVAAYDLATGSAYRARRCGDLGIFPPRDKAEAEERQAAQAKVTVERGRVSVEGLREAALMAMLWPRREEALDSFRASPDMPVAPLPRGFKYPGPNPPPDGMSSADTLLSWDWIRQGKIWSSGKMMSPGLRGLGEHYPSWLLEIAEESLQPGCPPAPLAPGVLGQGSPLGGVSPIDASQDALDATEKDLARALTDAVGRGCEAGR